ncbi:MAG TPA: hypothetical protein VLC09_20085, partial [Polyangiaceae bacterium]|nr:hypothetical protein [Polyangiaceae bacterium]
MFAGLPLAGCAPQPVHFETRLQPPVRAELAVDAPAPIEQSSGAVQSSGAAQSSRAALAGTEHSGASEAPNTPLTLPADRERTLHTVRAFLIAVQAAREPSPELLTNDARLIASDTIRHRTLLSALLERAGGGGPQGAPPELQFRLESLEPLSDEVRPLRTGWAEADAEQPQTGPWIRALLRNPHAGGSTEWLIRVELHSVEPPA